MMRAGLRRVLVGATAAAAAFALSTAPANAINSYNAEPAPERTEVGTFMVLWDRSGDGSYDRFDWYCSGTMIDEDTYLTASHCVVDWGENPQFFVSLEQDVQTKLQDAYDEGLSVEQAAQRFQDNGWAVAGEPVAHPDYPGNSRDSHDIAVMEFDGTTPADVWSFTPATLPTAGQLNDRAALADAEYVVAGYGTEEANRERGGHVHPGGGVRMKAPLSYNALNKTWLRLDMHAQHGNGGACYGDSGGPNFAFLDGQMILASTTITGDGPCYATNVTYRMDTESARSFLAPYVELP